MAFANINPLEMENAKGSKIEFPDTDIDIGFAGMDSDEPIKISAEDGYLLSYVKIEFIGTGSESLDPAILLSESDDPVKELDRFTWEDHFTKSYKYPSYPDGRITVETIQQEVPLKVIQNIGEHIESSFPDNETPDFPTAEDKVLTLETSTVQYELKDITITITQNGTDSKTVYSISDNPAKFNDGNTKFELDLSAEIDNDNTEKIKIEAPEDKVGDITFYPKLTNATSNINTSLAGGDTERGYVNSRSVIKLYADKDRFFQDGIEIQKTLKSSSDEILTFYPDAESDQSYFNEDNTEFTYDLQDDWDFYAQHVSISVTAEATEKVSGNDPIEGATSDFVNVYSVDNGILSEIANKRWTKVSSGLPDGSDVNADMGEYIFSVYKFPMKIEEDLISSDQSKISMGFHKIDIKAPYLLKSRLEIDLGQVEVPEKHNNVYDYKNVETVLHVPYAQPIDVIPDYVIGQTVSLSLHVDLYTGSVTLDIYSSKIEDNLVQRNDVPMSYDIPFMQRKPDTVLNDIGRFIYNTVETPFIEVIKPIPYDHETPYGKEGKEYGKLEDFIGYVEVSDVKLQTEATAVERNKIKSELSDGVFINTDTN